MAPMVHGLEAKYFQQIDFFFLDADDPNTLGFQRTYGFQYQPYFVLLDGQGKVIKRWTGFVPQETFESAFAEVLSASP